MSHEEVDRILSKQEEILPSSGFANSVMQAVRQEAAVPPPIPFPWKHALPGIVAAAGILIYLLVEIARNWQSGSRVAGPSAQWLARFTPLVNATISPEAGWVALALTLAFVSLTLPIHLASRKI